MEDLHVSQEHSFGADAVFRCLGRRRGSVVAAQPFVGFVHLGYVHHDGYAAGDEYAGEFDACVFGQHRLSAGCG